MQTPWFAPEGGLTSIANILYDILRHIPSPLLIQKGGSEMKKLHTPRIMDDQHEGLRIHRG
jgi:hypothetical protein